MPKPAPDVQHVLTAAQAWLLERHKNGLLRAASTLSAKNGMAPTDMMFTLADRKGRIGRVLGDAVPVSAIGPVALPGRAAELNAWVQRLAVHGPVWDLSGPITGIPVIVIDEHDAMAVVRLGEQSQWQSAASDTSCRTAQ
jgi:hypothetical protein